MMEKHWYVIRTTEVVERESRQYIGTSPLNEAEMVQALGGNAPIGLEDLTYVSLGGELKKYSEEWEPHPNRVLLSPRHIISVVPLKENWHEYNASWDASLLSRMEDIFKSIKG